MVDTRFVAIGEPPPVLRARNRSNRQSSMNLADAHMQPVAHLCPIDTSESQVLAS